MALMLIISSLLTISWLVYKIIKDRKKYDNTVYLKNLHTIKSFLIVIYSLDDYVTWVHRDEIKADYKICR